MIIIWFIYFLFYVILSSVEHVRSLFEIILAGITKKKINIFREIIFSTFFRNVQNNIVS